MPPKFKFTKDEIVNAAVEVVRERGVSALRAKDIAEKLGVSTQPVFTCFSTMAEAKKEVYAAAARIYKSCVEKGLSEKIPFFGFGMAYIRFAKSEPELYKLLFFTPSSVTGDGAYAAMLSMNDKVIPSIKKTYNLSDAEAERLYRDMWLVVHSITSLSVTENLDFSDDEISKILTGFCVSIVKSIKEIDGFISGAFDRDEVFKKILKLN